MSDITTTAPIDGAILEQVVVGGDLSKLSPAQRLAYYRSVCASLGLNPLTKPFEYLHLNGRLVLYATRTATDQLAKQHDLSLSVVRTERIEDVYVVTVRATGRDGRFVENVGAVTLGSLRGDALANATMKALTKAYRRATLSYCGLGWLDETEIETIPEAQPVKLGSADSQPEPVPSGPQTAGAGVKRTATDWSRFWAQVRSLGLTAAEAHELLGVESMKEWPASLDEALERLKAIRSG